VVFFSSCVYGYGFLRGRNRSRRETLRASSTTIRDELLPFWRSKVKVTRDNKRATRCAHRRTVVVGRRSIWNWGGGGVV